MFTSTSSVPQTSNVESALRNSSTLIIVSSTISASKFCHVIKTRSLTKLYFVSICIILSLLFGLLEIFQHLFSPKLAASTTATTAAASTPMTTTSISTSTLESTSAAQTSLASTLTVTGKCYEAIH